MFFKFDSTLNRLRSVGSWEAVSYLALLFVAMPLKYLGGWEYGVKVIGPIHGLLWVAYTGLAILGHIDYKWHWKTTFWLFIASLLPFGPSVADSRLLNKVNTAG